MRLALLFSGGKDSGLASLLLREFYDVILITAHFGITDGHEHAAAAADALGLPFETVELDRAVADRAIEDLVADGFPRNGIQRVHEHALETVAGMDYDAIADGTRRDDRVPTVSRAQAQSLEDRHGVDYLAPLSGFGRTAVDRLVDEFVRVESGPSAEIRKGDYEVELRALLRSSHGEEHVDAVFPDHEQTRVRGLR